MLDVNLESASRPTLGESADQLFSLQAEIKAREAEIAPLKAKLSEMKRVVLDDLYALEQTMAAGVLGKIIIKVSDLPTVPAQRWEDFYSYVHANQAYHLLHKRLSTTAVMEILQEGEEIPGVEIFTKRELKVSGI